jgi:hypothetical protein
MRSQTFARLAVVAGLTLGACAPLGLYRPGDGNAPEVLDVVLREGRVDVSPSLVARGKVELDIVNEGTLEHGIHIVGPGVDEQSDELIVPGQHSRLIVRLTPGTYVLTCPDGDHAARGMRTTLTVVDSTGSFRR